MHRRRPGTAGRACRASCYKVVVTRVGSALQAPTAPACFCRSGCSCCTGRAEGLQLPLHTTGASLQVMVVAAVGVGGACNAMWDGRVGGRVREAGYERFGSGGRCCYGQKCDQPDGVRRAALRCAVLRVRGATWQSGCSTQGLVVLKTARRTKSARRMQRLSSSASWMQ